MNETLPAKPQNIALCQCGARNMQNRKNSKTSNYINDLNSKIHNKHSKIKRFASNEAIEMGAIAEIYARRHARTHQSNMRNHSFTKYIACIRSTNSIAQSMLQETLTIEHDIDVFKLILVLLHCWASTFFVLSTGKSILRHCHASQAPIQSYSLLLVVRTLGWSILNIFTVQSIVRMCCNNFSESKLETTDSLFFMLSLYLLYECFGHSFTLNSVRGQKRI